MCVCVYNVHTCLISQQRQQQYAVKILSHVAATPTECTTTTVATSVSSVFPNASEGGAVSNQI